MKAGQTEKGIVFLARIWSPLSQPDGGRTHTRTHTDTHTSIQNLSPPEIEAAGQDEWLFSSIKHPLNEAHCVCVCVCVCE